jgi:hypothetical protein
VHRLKEGKLKAMSIHEDEHLRKMSLASLAKQCKREINAAQRGKAHNDQYWVELLRRTTAQRDGAARRVMWHHLGQVVRAWIGYHPSRDIASQLESEAYYVAQTCERFWQAITQQELAINRLSTIPATLRYARACLNGVILDTLRGANVYSTGISLPGPTGPGELVGKGQEDSRAMWESICEMLPNEREQRVAYLLFHCGLRPGDIVRLFPQEFSDLQEISRVRHTAIERLLSGKIASVRAGSVADRVAEEPAN